MIDRLSIDDIAIGDYRVTVGVQHVYIGVINDSGIFNLSDIGPQAKVSPSGTFNIKSGFRLSPSDPVGQASNPCLPCR